MPSCVVTGGAGFIGSHIAEELARSGHQVVVLDDLSTGRAENVEDIERRLRADRVDAKLRFVEATMLDGDALRAAFRGADCVFHQAALPSVAFSVEQPLESHHTNTEGTLGVLLAARDEGVRRVVYAGSSSAYGENEVLPKHEELATLPVSPYAVAKLTGEHYCRTFHRVYGLETVVLRYFNVFGPRQNPKSAYAAVIPLFATALLEGRALTVHGDGLQSRDFTYVENVVQANLLAMRAPAAVGRVMNVANGDRTSLLELIEMLERLCGVSAELEFGPPRAGDVKHSQADVALARECLGYAPKVGIEEGLRRTLEALEAPPSRTAA